MKYPLNALGQERFQELCQALLVKAFPDTRCFPTSQPDGGRDAVLPSAEDEGFVVFQVKFSTGKAKRKPARTWLIETLRSESKKLRALVPRGASQFVLITNAYASGALDSGSIDVVDQILQKHVPIQAACWWRDDLERRLDDAWDIKWAFPEALSNYDIIRMMLDHQDRASAVRRSQAIKAAIRDQFERDRDVRFKQVRIRSDLLDLFVDVPVGLPPLPEPGSPQRAGVATIHDLAHRRLGSKGRSEPSIGAASLILSKSCQEDVPRLVLEGAPGQGKSTIVQYLCQIHRHNLIQGCPDEGRVPAHHSRRPTRIPFKIDCRDLDTWLQGESPFAAAAELKVDGPRSLETLMCAQIEVYSGGFRFNVDDLHAALSCSPVLLAFDGLDEVANVGRRGEVVESIQRGVARLEETTLSVQTLVTSRPAAFSNSPAFSQDRYLYLNLTSITKEIIEKYTERWIAARDLDGREAAKVRRTLSAKVDEPHMAELARSPMQLAILLNLIHTRGVSLPDQRTALYDGYVDLVFTREAEKNVVVRDNRDLLVRIHQYLAWVLHSEAQTRATQGSVSKRRLRELVQRYLEEEEHDAGLVEELFSGITERVVALVARVEGRYEFEVQPLREYFAARHLYNTAPYSPAGQEKRGTLPERFNALSRDFFWHNVTRFYAGCYSRGELPSLVQSLKELGDSEGFSHTSYPRELASALLSDWTLAQYPRLMRELVAFVVDGHGLRYVGGRGVPRVIRSPSRLPWQCGGEALVERCFGLLSDGVANDYALVLLDLIRENAAPERAFKGWMRRLEVFKGELTRWISYGLFLGVLGRLRASVGEAMLDERDGVLGERILMFHQAGALGRSLRDAELEEATQLLLHGCATGMSSHWADDEFGRLRRALSTAYWALPFHFRAPGKLYDTWGRVFVGFDSDDGRRGGASLPKTELAEKCKRYTCAVEELARRFALSQWRGQLEPWSLLVEAGRRQFGDAWIFFVFASLASAIKSGGESCAEANRLFDPKSDLCRRARYARLRAGNAAWWGRQLAEAADWESRAFGLLLFFAWVGPSTMKRVGPLTNKMLESMPEAWWSRLHEGVSGPLRYWRRLASRPSAIGISDLPRNVCPRFWVMVSGRLKRSAVKEVYEGHLKDYEGTDLAVLDLCLETAYRYALKEKETSGRWLKVVSECYKKGARVSGYLPVRSSLALSVPLGLDVRRARSIVEACDAYPVELVLVAERVCRSSVANRVAPVGKVAEREGWFRSALTD